MVFAQHGWITSFWLSEPQISRTIFVLLLAFIAYASCTDYFLRLINTGDLGGYIGFILLEFCVYEQR